MLVGDGARLIGDRLQSSNLLKIGCGVLSYRAQLARGVRTQTREVDYKVHLWRAQLLIFTCFVKFHWILSGRGYCSESVICDSIIVVQCLY